MERNMLVRLLAVLVGLGLLLAACGAPATPTQAPAATAMPAPSQAPAATSAAATTAPAAFASVASGKKTATGFDCPEPNPRLNVTSKQLNMFVWTQYIPQDIIDCFQLVYGVTVNRDEFSSAEEQFAKLSKGATGYDVAHVTDNVIPPMIRLGILEKLDQSKLPMSNFDPKYLNLSFDPGNVYTIPFEAGTSSIIVNTDKVTDLPKSWNDLWNPAYKGRIVSIDDNRAVIGVALLTLGYDVNTTDKSQLDQAKQKLLQFTPNVVKWDSDSPKTEMLDGTADLGIIYSGEAELAARENPALKYIYPTEGTIVWQDNWGIPAGAAHADAAYAWLNYSLQADVFWLMMCDFPYTNPDQAAVNFAKGNPLHYQDDSCNSTLSDLYDAYNKSNITNISDADFKAGHRAVDVGDAVPLYDQIWTEIKGGQ
jgi:spermidine/putrescine transport system substrate-binding protein